MSLAEVERLLRATGDSSGFAAQVASDPAILTGYDLTAEERRALVGHDLGALRAMGVEESLLQAVRSISPASDRRV